MNVHVDDGEWDKTTTPQHSHRNEKKKKQQIHRHNSFNAY